MSRDIFDEIEAEATGAKPVDIFDEIETEAQSSRMPSINPVTELPKPSLMAPQSGATDAEVNQSNMEFADAKRRGILEAKQNIEQAEAEAEALRVLGSHSNQIITGLRPGQRLTLPETPRMAGSDIVPLLRSGLATAVLSPAEMMLKASGAVPPITQNAIDEQRAKMSEAAKNPQTIPQTLAVTTLESAPSMLPLMGAGRVAQMAGAGKKALTLGLALGEGAQAAQQNATQVADEIRATPLETLAQSDAFREAYAKTPEWYTPQQRGELARDVLASHRALAVAGITLPVTALFSRLTQAGAIGRMLEPDVAQSRVRRFLGAVTSEAIQEAPQSGTESVWTDIGAAPARPGLTPEDITKNALTQAAYGAASGGLLGVPGGGMAAIPSTRRPTPVRPPVLPPAPAPRQLPVSEPAQADPLVEIANDPALKDFPEATRMQFATVALTRGMAAANEFLKQTAVEGAARQAEAARMVAADMADDATDQALSAVDDRDATIAAEQAAEEDSERQAIEAQDEEEALGRQERYPRKATDDEKRSDDRYRQYRRAGYSDSDAMGFVEQDMLDDMRGALNNPKERSNVTQKGKVQREQEGEGENARATPERSVETAIPGPEAGTGSRAERVPVSSERPVEAGAPGGQAGPAAGRGGAGAGEGGTGRGVEVSRSPEANAGQPASPNVETESTDNTPAGRGGVGDVATRIAAKLDEVSFLGGVSRESVEEQFNRYKEGKTPEDAEAGLDKTIARLRPKAATFKGISTTKRVADLTDEEFAKVVAPDPAVMTERNVELGRYQDDPRFLVPVKGKENAVETDFNAVRAYLKTGALSERGRQIEEIGRRVKEKLGRDAPPTSHYKTGGHILRAIETGRYNDIMHPDNKASRSVFTELTGVELPKTVSGTRAVFQGKPFAMKSSPSPAPSKSAEPPASSALVTTGTAPSKAVESAQTAQEPGAFDQNAGPFIVSWGTRSKGDKYESFDDYDEAVQFAKSKMSNKSVDHTRIEDANGYERDESEIDSPKPEPAGLKKIRETEARRKKADGPSKAPEVKSPTENLSNADKARLKELQDRLRKKLRGQVAMGFDPEVVTIGAEIAGIYIKGGVKTFRQFAEKVKADMGDIWDDAKRYLHGFWTTAAADHPEIEEVTRGQAQGVVDVLSTKVEPAAKGIVKVEQTAPGEKTISVPSEDKEGLPPKEQKKYLLAEIDKAIALAPDDISEKQNDPAIKALDERASGIVAELGDVSMPQIEGWRNRFTALGRELDDINTEKKRILGTVIIEVPNDGTFEIINYKQALQTFKKQAAKFPVGSVSSDVGSRTGSFARASVAVAKTRPSTEADMKAAVEPMVGTDETRKILTEVHVDGKAKAVVATDGRRLAVALDAPFKTTKHLKPEVRVQKGAYGKDEFVETGNMVEDEYPNWVQVTPGGVAGEMPKSGFENHADVDTAALSLKVKQAMVAVAKKDALTVELYLTPDGAVEVATKEADGDGYESGDISKATRIGRFNAKFLLDGLDFMRRMANKKARIEWGSDGTPILLLGKREYYLLMPLSIDSEENFRLRKTEPVGADTENQTKKAEEAQAEPATKVEEPTTATTKKTENVEYIQDFGEKIGGARKTEKTDRGVRMYRRVEAEGAGNERDEWTSSIEDRVRRWNATLAGIQRPKWSVAPTAEPGVERDQKAQERRDIAASQPLAADQDAALSGPFQESHEAEGEGNDYAEGSGQTIPDGQAGLWRTRLDQVRNGGTRYDQERFAQVQVDEEATQDAAFQEAYQVAKEHGFELIPVTGLDYGGVHIGKTILVSSDTARWGGYNTTLAHEVFHDQVEQGDPDATAAVASARADDAAMTDYMDRLDRQAPNWHDEMFADARRRLGPHATIEQIADDIANQIAEEIAADRAMGKPIPKVIDRRDQAGRGLDARHADLERRAKAGDKQAEAEAQKMVEEAAKKAGYNVGPVWHGTDADFNVFDVNKAGQNYPELDLRGVFFSGRREDAGTDNGPGKRTIQAFVKLENPIFETMHKGKRYPHHWASATSSMGWFDNNMDRLYFEAEEMSSDGIVIRNRDDAADQTIVVFDASQIKSADPFTYRDDGTLIPLSERFNPQSPDIRYRRIEPKQFPAISPEDLARINEKIAKMTAAQRLKAVTQAKAKLATFQKGPAKSETIRGVVGEAEKAGEKEVTDAVSLLREAIRPREKMPAGKALARLDAILLALTQIKADIAAMKAPREAQADEARRRLAGTLFRGKEGTKRVLAQYRPLRLLDALIDAAEKRIMAVKGRAVTKAAKRYSEMNANVRSKAYMDLTNEGRRAMDEWLAMVQGVKVADVPTHNPDLYATKIGPDGTLRDAAGNEVGRYDDDWGYFITDPKYQDLRSLHETLESIEEQAGAARKQRAEAIATQAIAEGNLIVDDVRKAGPPYGEEELRERLSTGETPKEKASFLRGRPTKFRSIFYRLLGPQSHAWRMIENLRRGDTAAKGMKARAEHELEAVLKSEGISQEEEYRWRSERVLMRLPGMERPIGFTRAELISLYNTLQDPASREILLNAGAKTDRLRQDDYVIRTDPNADVDNRSLFRAVERHVQGNPKLLRVAEAMQEIMVRHGQAANQVSRYFYGSDEFVNPTYWPRSVARKSSITTDDDVTNARRAVEANLKNIGLSKRRVRHNNPLVIQDAFRVFDEHMGDIARYTHLTIPANELLNAMGAELDRKDTGATSAMRQFQLAFGQQYRGHIANGLRTIMSGEQDQADSSILRAFKAFGRRISGGTLALSPSAILQNRYGGMANLAAWFRARAPGDKAKIAADFVRIAAMPQSLRGPEVRALMENGYLDDRWSGKSLRLALMGGAFDASDIGFFRMADRWTDTMNRPLVAREMANAVAAYKALTRNGISSEEAVDLIEQANRDTQNSTSELDKSQMAREIQTVFSTWFPFSSQGLVQWDFYLDNLAQGKREGWSAADPRRTATATAAVLNLFLLSMVIAAAMKLLRKDDREERPAALAAEAAMQALEQRVPWMKMFTDPLSAIMATGKAGPVNMVERSLSNIANTLARIVSGKGDYRDGINLATDAGKAMGLPVGGISQAVKVLLAQMGLETEGMKMRREDRWFDKQVKDLDDGLSSAVLRRQADQLYQDAINDSIIPFGYSKEDFRSRIRSRYRGAGKTVSDAKVSLKEY